MKGVLILATLSFLFDSVSATPFNINLQKNNDSLLLRCNRSVQELKTGETVDIGNYETGTWNGKVFSVTSSQPSTDCISISSRNVPLCFRSLQTSQCDVYAPGLSILGSTKINTFAAKIKNQKTHLLNIKGSLSTQNFTVTGPIKINGTVSLTTNGSLTFKNPGFNTLIVNGSLSSEGILHIQKENCPKASVINNGTISSSVGIIACSLDEFTNESTGQMQGEEARFYIGPDGAFQNFGTFKFKKLLFKSLPL